jgi:hypothetical protein
MYRLMLVLASLLVVFPVWADDEDGYISENHAKSVRPAPPREARRQDDKKKETTKRETLRAEDVDKILAEKGKDRAVRGKVVEVYAPRSGTVLIFNFGKDHKKCFKAVIYKGSFDKWEGGVEAIKKMVEGKTVVVEGVISEYQKLPQIVLNVPSQLRVEK